MPFNIIRNDITRLEVDAIVNAANQRLLAGGGVCGAIFAAAGATELQKECNEIGYCGIGQAVITKGYRLKAKYVIHTVGPVYGEDPKNEEEQLYSCYKSSLNLAKENNLSSIAFPVISSGIFGYPKAEAIKIATRAIKDFLEENEMDVFLVVYDKDVFRISEKLFCDVKSYIDENMVVPDERRRFDEASMRVTSCCDAPADETDDACCDEDFDLSMPEPPVGDVPVFYEWKHEEGVKARIKKKKSLEELMNADAETFSQMLLRLIDEKGMSDVCVYKRANIDRKLFSKIRKKDYVPKKTTVIALIIALQLNMGEARELLARAGFAFSKSSKFDIIIQFFIEQKNYDIYEINETLFMFEQPLLGI